MKQLIAGITKFQNEVFPKNRHVYEALAVGQKPHTLFIGCADSRLMPNEFTQTQPGELFICRNAGNIVPPYGDVLGGVSATVEYAVQILKVENVVVCGHSDCGAMRALMKPDEIRQYRAVSKWIQQAERVAAVSREIHADLDEDVYLDRLIEENVITQLDNLATYPGVAARMRRGNLTMHGIVFDIATGTVKMLDRSTYTFRPVNEFEEFAEELQLQSK